MAAIIHGVKKRGLEGNASNPERAKRLGTIVPVLAAKAIELVEGRAGDAKEGA